MSSPHYAGFWLRFVAYIIDVIVIQIIQTFLILPILGLIGLGIVTQGWEFNFDQMNEMDAFTLIATIFSLVSSLILIAYAIEVLYFSVMESSKYQATIGKMVLGLKVTDELGRPLEFPRALLRNFGKIISAMLFMLGYILAGITRQKQALHDIIASSLVVSK